MLSGAEGAQRGDTVHMGTSADAWLRTISGNETETAPFENVDGEGVGDDTGVPLGAPLGAQHGHKVWLSVWWPDTPVVVNSAIGAVLPEDLSEDVFGAIPAHLHSAVAYAVLTEVVAQMSQTEHTRDAVGWEDADQQWTLALPVSINNDDDLVAFFHITLDSVSTPEKYTFTSWHTPSQAQQEVLKAHHRGAPWKNLPNLD